MGETRRDGAGTRAAKDALFDGLATVAKALASGRRAEILELLAQGERSVERSALLTIDLQRDFLSDSSHGIAGTTEVLPRVRELVAAFRVARRPIVHVVRLYLLDGSNADLARRGVIASGAAIVLPGTPGSQLAQGLAPDGASELMHDQLLAGQLQPLGLTEHVMFKPRWNAFYDTGLNEHLRLAAVDTVVVVGCNYPNCPRGTLFGASERDYRAVVVSDAVSQWNERASTELGSLGVLTASTEEILSQLAGIDVNASTTSSAL